MVDAQLSRCTQRPSSVKYLFGEANVAYNFLLLEDDQTVDDRSIHLQFFTPQVRLFFLKKGNLKFSNSKMRWGEESEKFSLSSYGTG